MMLWLPPRGQAELEETGAEDWWGVGEGRKIAGDGRAGSGRGF